MTESETSTHADPETTPQVDGFAKHFALVAKLAIGGAVIGGIAGVCFVVGYFTYSDEPQIGNAIIAPLVCAAVGSAMVFGLALLFAPASFYESDRGQECLKVIGTKSAMGGRVVVLVCLLLGCGFIFMMSLGFLQAFGIID